MFKMVIGKLADQRHSQETSHTNANSAQSINMPINPVDIKKIAQISEKTKEAFKTFLQDANDFSTSKVLHEIDEICSDETGENIDMEQLNTFLDLCFFSRDKGV